MTVTNAKKRQRLIKSVFSVVAKKILVIWSLDFITLVSLWLIAINKVLALFTEMSDELSFTVKLKVRLQCSDWRLPEEKRGSKRNTILSFIRTSTSIAHDWEGQKSTADCIWSSVVKKKTYYKWKNLKFFKTSVFRATQQQWPWRRCHSKWTLSHIQCQDVMWIQPPT